MIKGSFIVRRQIVVSVVVLINPSHHKLLLQTLTLFKNVFIYFKRLHKYIYSSSLHLKIVLHWCQAFDWNRGLQKGRCHVMLRVLSSFRNQPLGWSFPTLVERSLAVPPTETLPRTSDGRTQGTRKSLTFPGWGEQTTALH